jgi:hypothetical protein
MAETELKLKIPPYRVSASDGSSASTSRLESCLNFSNGQVITYEGHRQHDVDEWLNNLNQQLSQMSGELELIKIILAGRKNVRWCAG